MKYTLSIITSVLNPGKEAIIQTRDSLIPINDEIQWVYVDGGSKDESWKEVLGYTEPFMDPGTTLYGGFNRGLSFSQGRYIYYLNAGDTIHSHGALDQLITTLKEAREDLYYFNTLVNDGHLFPMLPPEMAPYRMTFSHQGCVMSRRRMIEFGAFNEMSGPAADHELIVKFFLNDFRIKKLDIEPLTKCADWESTEDDIGRCLNRWRNIRNLYKKFRPDQVTELDRNYFSMLESFQVNRKTYGHYQKT